MTQITRCDGCGAEAESNNNDFYDLNRYTEEQAETGNFCPDCVPDELVENLNVETFDNE